MTLNKGDIVYLKSGSPALVVSGHARSTDGVFVAWFAGEAYFEQCVSPKVLTDVKPKQRNKKKHTVLT